MKNEGSGCGQGQDGAPGDLEHEPELPAYAARQGADGGHSERLSDPDGDRHREAKDARLDPFGRVLLVGLVVVRIAEVLERLDAIAQVQADGADGRIVTRARA